MLPIVTITFNPSIDISTSVSALLPDKKLHCTAPEMKAGGGGINVARAITKLGGKAKAICIAGGYNAPKFRRLLEEEGVETIVIDNPASVRENVMVMDSSHHLQYQFIMPGEEVAKASWEKLLAIIDKQQAELIVLSGSLPPGVPPSVCSAIAKSCKQKHIRLIADSSGAALQELLKAGAYLIKPNLGELSKLAGVHELDYDSTIKTARKLIEQGSCEAVAVSLGAAGALLVSRGIVQQFTPPVIKIKNTVGAGDSMVAGIAIKLSVNEDLQEAVRYGVACGTAATMHSGTGLCTKEDADRLYQVMLNKEQDVIM